jgi:uncharacterized protein (DUF433 family)
MADSSDDLKIENRIIRDRGICGGQPVFKGTRVTLRTVLASLAVILSKKSSQASLR